MTEQEKGKSPADSSSRETLADLGEFEILKNIVFPAAGRHGIGLGLGDDCGFIELSKELLAVSADAGPKPLVWQLPGHSDDYQAAGWHAAVATASDIATAGARPLFLVDTIDAPPTFLTADLDEFMDGYFAACSAFGFECIGGDVRQGSSLTARVFGVGVVDHGRRIGRGGARPGDSLMLIGAAGEFISAYLAAERAGDEPTPAVSRTLRFPKAQLREMQILASHRLITSASDSSDGVLGAIDNIAKRSGCGFQLTLGDELLSTELKRAAQTGEYDPWNLFFFWGDWSVVTTVPSDLVEEFTAVANDNAIAWKPLGYATEGSAETRAMIDGRSRRVAMVRNENFVKRGFNAGIREHVDYMLRADLFHEEAARR